MTKPIQYCKVKKLDKIINKKIQLYINSSQKDSSKSVSLIPIRCTGNVHDEIDDDFQKTNDNEATTTTTTTKNRKHWE